MIGRAARCDIVEARFVDIVVNVVEAGTRVDIVAEDVPDGISAEDHAAGLASSLTNPATYLEQ